ncbi:bactericidal permeability-increasing protein-like [Lingula anatina]|uniref:Bactericidal permeability-increasing protein-like n=1 Tax=Lingula anatina TaxID=7574 RepID=A0A1S3IHG0_LINAN|nr:bactericidal permeability-increasing protein-like [Lingula anatina]|eukprot:XP_013396924.1 bactericidal permeability-increasing protein-like [Lingula anatina]
MTSLANNVAVITIVGLIGCVKVGEAVNPGLKVRITQVGLNFAEKSLVDNLGRKITGAHIDDQHGTADVGIGKFDYDITNLQITAFNRPQSHMSVLPGSGLGWRTSGGHIQLHGDWRYKSRGWIKISDHGSFDISVDGIDFQLAVGLGKDFNGRPSIAVRQCNAGLGSVRVTLHGGASWLYNLFRGSIERPIKEKVSSLLCPAARKEINDNAEKHLANLKVTTKVGKDLELDYRLIQPPQFHTGYVESFHKGLLKGTTDKTDPPVEAPDMPEMTGSTRMLYVQMSEYVMNTAGYVLHKHGLLRYYLTSIDVPEDQRHYFKTSCEGEKTCMGRIVPQVGEKFPNCTVSMDLQTTEPPTLSVTAGKISGHFRGDMRFYVKHPEQPKNIYVFTASSVYIIQICCN